MVESCPQGTARASLCRADFFGGHGKSCHPEAPFFGAEVPLHCPPVAQTRPAAVIRNYFNFDLFENGLQFLAPTLTLHAPVPAQPAVAETAGRPSLPGAGRSSIPGRIRIPVRPTARAGERFRCLRRSTGRFILWASVMIISTMSQAPRSICILRTSERSILSASTGNWRKALSDELPMPKSSRITTIPMCLRWESTVIVSLGSDAATLSVISSCNREGSTPVSRSAS